MVLLIAYIHDSVLVAKSLTVLAITIALFMLHSVIHVDAAVITLAGATLLMLIGMKSEHKLEETLQAVEWITIFFFIGLFILVGGLFDVGIIGKLVNCTLEMTGGAIGSTSMLILWVSSIASANVIVAGMVQREGKGFSYVEFLKVGLPLTLISLGISALYVHFIVL